MRSRRGDDRRERRAVAGAASQRSTSARRRSRLRPALLGSAVVLLARDATCAGSAAEQAQRGARPRRSHGVRLAFAWRGEAGELDGVATLLRARDSIRQPLGGRAVCLARCVVRGRSSRVRRRRTQRPRSRVPASSTRPMSRPVRPRRPNEHHRRERLSGRHAGASARHHVACAGASSQPSSAAFPMPSSRAAQQHRRHRRARGSAEPSRRKSKPSSRAVASTHAAAHASQLEASSASTASTPCRGKLDLVLRHRAPTRARRRDSRPSRRRVAPDHEPRRELRARARPSPVRPSSSNATSAPCTARLRATVDERRVVRERAAIPVQRWIDVRARCPDRRTSARRPSTRSRLSRSGCPWPPPECP